MDRGCSKHACTGVRKTQYTYVAHPPLLVLPRSRRLPDNRGRYARTRVEHRLLRHAEQLRELPALVRVDRLRVRELTSLQPVGRVVVVAWRLARLPGCVGHVGGGGRSVVPTAVEEELVAGTAEEGGRREGLAEGVAGGGGGGGGGGGVAVVCCPALPFGHDSGHGLALVPTLELFPVLPVLSCLKLLLVDGPCRLFRVGAGVHLGLGGGAEDHWRLRVSAFESVSESVCV